MAIKDQTRWREIRAGINSRNNSRADNLAMRDPPNRRAPQVEDNLKAALPAMLMIQIKVPNRIDIELDDVCLIIRKYQTVKYRSAYQTYITLFN